MSKTTLAATTALFTISTLLGAGVAGAQDYSDDVIKIGIMNDQAGVYSDNCGPGSVEAARMAIEDFGGEVNGKKIELLIADDQNKPDLGVPIAQKWVGQEGVDTIVGCSASNIALPIQEFMATAKKPYLIAGSASSALTNDKCTPYSTQWILDTYAMAKGAVAAMLAAEKDSFFFITVDNAFGKQWQADATTFIEAGGGKVMGSVTHPLNSTDFSSFLLQAQASGAKVIILANSGGDFSNAVKQAGEFGIQAGGQEVIALGLQINQVHGIGLATLKGLNLVMPGVYWDQDDETRAFAERFKARFRDRVPNESMTGTYSAINHYLKAVKEAGTDDGEKVNAKMREMPINDFQLKNVSIRADGQVMRPWYAFTIKAPEDVKYPYDYYVLNAEIPAEDIWRPEADSACPLFKG